MGWAGVGWRMGSDVRAACAFARGGGVIAALMPMPVLLFPFFDANCLLPRAFRSTISIPSITIFPAFSVSTRSFDAFQPFLRCRQSLVRPTSGSPVASQTKLSLLRSAPIWASCAVAGTAVDGAGG